MLQQLMLLVLTPDADMPAERRCLNVDAQHFTDRRLGN